MRTSRCALTLAVICAMLIGGHAQQPQAPPPAPTAPQSARPNAAPTEDEEVVRINANLVQLDAVVTDKKGQPVPDLRAEDFEVLEDGRPQRVTYLSYVAAQPDKNGDTPPAPAPVDKHAPPAPPAPPVNLTPSQVRRTIALVVDDLGLSFESTVSVREALKKFVNTQMQPGDLVAIIRTSAGVGALQQFTGDRRQLLAAIERVRWYPTGRGGVSAFAPLAGAPLDGGGGPRAAAQAQTQTDADTELDNFREDVFAAGTLGAINYVVRGMRALPGRKSVLLLSDGITLFNKEGRNERVFTAIQQLIDLANRAAVVIYTMDARGLQTLSLTAADDTTNMSAADVRQALDNRSLDFFNSQDGLNYLAQQTGGLFIHNTNDLAAGVRRILADERSYYLLSYRPDEQTFDRRTGHIHFNKLTIKIKNRPELVVRYRKGFYGVPDEQAKPVTQQPRFQQLMTALTSPFSSGDVHLHLTSLFANDQRAGSFMRSLVHIDGRDLSFTDEPDGWHKATIDVLAITFGDNGQVIDQLDRTETVRVRDEAYTSLRNNGLIYNINVPIKKAGAYQLRFALRDAPTGRVGSASQFIEVPDINKKRLALSGLVVSGLEPPARQTPVAQNSGAPASANSGATTATLPEGALVEPDPQAGPALRRLHERAYLEFAYIIYNAQLDKATALPQLTTQVRLFRDGQPVFEGQPQPINVTHTGDLRRLAINGRLHLGTNLTPGQYIIQVVVTDALADAKHRVATQWSDLEIVK